MQNLMTSKEAAKMLNISTRTLELIRKVGKLPFLKVGRQVRFRPEDLEKWILGRCDGWEAKMIKKIETEKRINRLIGKIDDVQALTRIMNVLRARQKLVQKRRNIRLAAEAWGRALAWKQDQKLYCCMSGVMLGGPVQRGTELTLYCIQPRKKIAWFSLDSGQKSIGMTPWQLHRYQLREEAPDNPISEFDKRACKGINAVLHAVDR